MNAHLRHCSLRIRFKCNAIGKSHSGKVHALKCILGYGVAMEVDTFQHPQRYGTHTNTHIIISREKEIEKERDRQREKKRVVAWSINSH